MSRPLGLTKHQARTLLQAAEAEQAIVEVTIGAMTFRLIPACLTSPPAKSVDAEPEIRL